MISTVSVEAGKKVLDQYNYWVKKLYLKSYTYDQIAIANKFKDTAIFLEGVGDQYLISDVWSGTMDSLMQKLAKASSGDIPTLASISAVFRDQATSTFSFVNLQNSTSNPVVFVAAGMADTVLNGVQSIGNTVINTGDSALAAVENSAKVLKWALPIVLLAGLGFYAYVKLKPKAA